MAWIFEYGKILNYNKITVTESGLSITKSGQNTQAANLIKDYRLKLTRD